MKQKLTLEQLSVYLPYKVKAKLKIVNVTNCRSYVIGTIGEIADNCKITCYDTVNSYPDKFKLLLRPMSALDDKVLSDINCDLSDQIKMAEFRDKQISLYDMPYGAVKILLKRHFDVFNLIEKGLAKPIK